MGYRRAALSRILLVVCHHCFKLLSFSTRIVSIFACRIREAASDSRQRWFSIGDPVPV